MTADPPSGWTYWGEWRLVGTGSATIMLFKSNAHLDFPGQTYLTDLINLLIQQVQPELILSIGTAGGAQTGDHIGTVRAVSAGTLYESGVVAADWPVYSNAWSAVETVLDNTNFSSLLFAVPTVASDLQSLCSQFNQNYGASFTFADLDPAGLIAATPAPQIAKQTGVALSLLTTPTFVLGATAGAYQSYACIEMDDTIIADVCKAAGIAFGFVRNISDPVQNVTLTAKVQGEWGSTIYDAYGFYTSCNGALAAWAMLAGEYPAA